MQFTVSEAEAKLAELVKRAERGEEIVLTRHGHEVGHELHDPICLCGLYRHPMHRPSRGKRPWTAPSTSLIWRRFHRFNA